MLLQKRGAGSWNVLRRLNRRGRWAGHARDDGDQQLRALNGRAKPARRLKRSGRIIRSEASAVARPVMVPGLGLVGVMIVSRCTTVIPVTIGMILLNVRGVVMRRMGRLAPTQLGPVAAAHGQPQGRVRRHEPSECRVRAKQSSTASSSSMLNPGSIFPRGVNASPISRDFRSPPRLGYRSRAKYRVPRGAATARCWHARCRPSRACHVAGQKRTRASVGCVAAPRAWGSGTPGTAEGESPRTNDASVTAVYSPTAHEVRSPSNRWVRPVCHGCVSRESGKTEKPDFPARVFVSV